MNSSDKLQGKVPLRTGLHPKMYEKGKKNRGLGGPGAAE